MLGFLSYGYYKFLVPAKPFWLVDGPFPYGSCGYYKFPGLLKPFWLVDGPFPWRLCGCYGYYKFLASAKPFWLVDGPFPYGKERKRESGAKREREKEQCFCPSS